MVLAHFEPTTSPKTVANLQNITIRLFAAFVVAYNGAFSPMEEKDGCGNRDGSDGEIWLAKGQKGK